MHELSITQNMFELVLEQAEKANAKKVGKINLVIGEMTGFARDSVQFYFDLISKETIAQGAVLSIRMVPPKAQCHQCGEAFEPEEPDWTCPHCRSRSIKIIAGQELYVESIEVE